MEVVQLQRLPEGEDVFGTVVARESLADGVLGGGAPSITKLGERSGGLHPGHDRADHPHPRRPGDVGDDVVKTLSRTMRTACSLNSVVNARRFRLAMTHSYRTFVRSEASTKPGQVHLGRRTF